MPTSFFADLVREMCQEGGTGPLTPTGAVPGHRRFAEAVPPGMAFHYAVAGIAQPGQWETGLGHIDGSGRLVREIVAASSDGGNAVDFAPGLKTIALTVGAGWFASSDAAAAATAAGLAMKQPISTIHGAVAAVAAGDQVTVRRGSGWVNVPIAAFACRDSGGRFGLDGALAVPNGSAPSPSLGFAGYPDTGLFCPGDKRLGIATGGTERVRIDDAGNVGFGHASPQCAIDIQRGDQSEARLRIRNSGSGGHVWDMVAGRHGVSNAGFSIFNATNLFTPFAITNAGDVGIGTSSPAQKLDISGSGGSGLQLSNADDAGRGGRLSSTGSGGIGSFNILTNTPGYDLRFGINGTALWRIDANTHLRPESDNQQQIGYGSLRVKDIFLGNGPTVTSDAVEKTWRGAPSGAELAAARKIAGALGFFQWNAAIALKGSDRARRHFGIRAQTVWAVMAEEGLVEAIGQGGPPDCAYAFLCYDEWAEERDDAGAVVRAAGHRLGIRPDQLALFLIASQEHRLAALEAAA